MKSGVRVLAKAGERQRARTPAAGPHLRRGVSGGVCCALGAVVVE